MKLQLAKLLFIKCPNNTWLACQKRMNKLVELAVTM